MPRVIVPFSVLSSSRLHVEGEHRRTSNIYEKGQQRTMMAPPRSIIRLAPRYCSARAFAGSPSRLGRGQQQSREAPDIIGFVLRTQKAKRGGYLELSSTDAPPFRLGPGSPGRDSYLGI
jgi:hypothetical protein